MKEFVIARSVATRPIYCGCGLTWIASLKLAMTEFSIMLYLVVPVRGTLSSGVTLLDESPSGVGVRFDATGAGTTAV